ncbi:hypothetical protein EMCG_08564 [[Emmonsia] crescens]|uniref:Uncharacterized protein n=1 Tax=[Emmonsia] crescens TaxID=73230 RepID=A0A0G2I5T3_9EURO|nr:hypothetical protein EMCG_08564 [Emmonsia crescens UAMH 3008]
MDGRLSFPFEGYDWQTAQEKENWMLSLLSVNPVQPEQSIKKSGCIDGASPRSTKGDLRDPDARNAQLLGCLGFLIGR